MKNRIIIISFVTIIVAVLISSFLIKNNKNDILLNNDKQVDVLLEIYNDFISDIDNKENIVLSDDSLKNIITREFFDESNIKRLKSIECQEKSSNNIYTLDIEFYPRTNVLNIIIHNNENGYSGRSQKYKLSVKNGRINYKRFGAGTIIAS